MPTSTAEPRRGLRDSPWGKVALLVGVLLVALVVSQSCGSRDTEISKEEAAEIARERVDFEPDRVATRFIPRGFQSRPTWAVSLSRGEAAAGFERLTVVVVDARTGDVVEVRQQG